MLNTSQSTLTRCESTRMRRLRDYLDGTALLAALWLAFLLIMLGRLKGVDDGIVGASGGDQGRNVAGCHGQLGEN